MKHSNKETRKQGNNQPDKKHKKHQLLTNKASGHSRGRQPKEQPAKHQDNNQDIGNPNEWKPKPGVRGAAEKPNQSKLKTPGDPADRGTEEATCETTDRSKAKQKANNTN